MMWREVSAPVRVCPDCIDFMVRTPHLTGACASVGIERGLTTAEAVQSYMTQVHRREGHES